MKYVIVIIAIDRFATPIEGNSRVEESERIKETIITTTLYP